MTAARRSAPRTKPDYGIDAPGVVRNLLLVAAAGLVAFASSRAGLWSGVIAHVNIANTGLGVAIGCGAMGAWMLYDSRFGKLRGRERLLDLVPWRGDEAVLDVGCGRGLMLVAAARRLPHGSATGLDLWQSEDLTGNRPEATLENARLEGVPERVHVRTGDMRDMPFPAGSFDIVVSNVAIHNIYDRDGREHAIREIARVLKPGGHVVIADIRHVDEYARVFAESGLDVRRTGSRLARLLLAIVTFGSLRPDTLVAAKR